MPPVAGCIKWSRSLFARVKITMQKLQDVGPELLQGETGQEVLLTLTEACIPVPTGSRIWSGLA